MALDRDGPVGPGDRDDRLRAVRGADLRRLVELQPPVGTDSSDLGDPGSPR